MSAPVLMTWRGRPVSDLTRDELLIALEEAHRSLVRGITYRLRARRAARARR